jgi:hypothetical protein
VYSSVRVDEGFRGFLELAQAQVQDSLLVARSGVVSLAEWQVHCTQFVAVLNGVL